MRREYLAAEVIGGGHVRIYRFDNRGSRIDFVSEAATGFVAEGYRMPITRSELRENVAAHCIEWAEDYDE